MVISPALFILFWIDLAILGVLCSQVDFTVIFCIPVKNVTGFLLDLHQAVAAILIVLILLQGKHGRSFHLEVSCFNFLLQCFIPAYL